MKRTLLILTLALSSIVAAAQDGDEIIDPAVYPDDEEIELDIFWSPVESSAYWGTCRDQSTQKEIPNCSNQRLFEFIADNLKYPEIGIENGIEGVIYIRFVIEKDGQVTNVEVMRGIQEEMDAEALRVVQMMPDWNPGTYQGKAIRTQFTLPIRFKL